MFVCDFNIIKISTVYCIRFVPYWAKKCGELWSTNKKVIGAYVDPPEWIFFEILNFGP